MFTAFYCREASDMDQLARKTKSNDLAEKAQGLEMSYRLANKEIVEDSYILPSLRPPEEING